MRFLCELFVVAGLIYLGWETPFAEWVGQKHGTPTLKSGVAQEAAQPAPASSSAAIGAVPPVAVATPRPSPTRSGSWMFDGSHHSPLDPPAAKSPHP